MKNTKKLAAMVAALTLSACSVAPMFSFATIEADLTSDAQTEYSTFKGQTGNSEKTVDEWLDSLKTADETFDKSTKIGIAETALNENGKAAYATFKGDSTNLEEDNKTIADWWITLDSYTQDKYRESTTANADGKTTFYLSLPSALADKSLSNVKAYKIFEVTPATSGVTVTGWADAFKTNTDIQKKLIKAAGLDDTAETLPTADVVAKHLKENADKAEAFAKVAVENLTAIEGGVNPAKTLATFTGTGLANGYYAFTCDVAGADNDTTTLDTNNNKTVSLGMLTVVNGTKKTIGTNGEAKVGLPTVQKKVLEDDTVTNVEDAPLETDTTNKKKWNDGADWAIGQEGKFKLYGTLPDNYDDYDHYYYEFCDTLGKEFDLCGTLTFTAGSATPITLTAEQVAALNATPTNIGGETGTQIWVTKTVNESTNETNLNIAVEDMKKLIKTKSTVTTDVITVEYGAKLNNKAVVGKTGQRNAVQLKYSNNPNSSWAPSKDDKDTPDNPGETPKDEVIVFTYALEFDKDFFEGTSKLTKQEILAGTYDNIEFSLDNDVYVRNATDDEKAAGYDYVIVDKATYNDSTNPATNKMKLKLVKGVKGKDGNFVETDENGKPTKFEEVQTTEKDSWGKDTSNIPDDVKLTIRIKGLDSAEYKITETKVADTQFEYNVLDEDHGKVIIEHAVQHTQSWDDFSADTIYTEIRNLFDKTVAQATDKDIVKKSGTVNGLVGNYKGTELPGTGGIGTTIFYLGGGAMVAVAGVFLITKKRMGKSEN